jgi:catechol 2,3-dioxygenase-like lactoylglutathione lyase family enzyme
MTTALQINHLQHAGIPVTDIRVSEAFYQRLGFSKVMESAFTLEGEQGVCIMMQHAAAMVELYQLPAHLLPGIRSRKDGRIDHIAFDVDDIAQTFALLRNEGFHIIEEAPVYLPFWDKGCRYFNITGPDGERLEFNQVIK